MFVVYCLLFVVCCLLFAVCCLLCVVCRCVPRAVVVVCCCCGRTLSLVVRRALCEVCRLLLRAA